MRAAGEGAPPLLPWLGVPSIFRSLALSFKERVYFTAISLFFFFFSFSGYTLVGPTIASLFQVPLPILGLLGDHGILVPAKTAVVPTILTLV